jgi:hypothetical protein
MTRRNLAPLAVAALLWGPRAWAHHSFAATYDRDKTVTVEGTVVEFLYRNPHSFVLVKSDGEKVVWAADWESAGQLSRRGIEKDALKPGDHVIASGYPSRNPADHRLHLESLVRPSDGWKWSSGPR